jgi:asparagine synthase (glutamine-hydrolysing)
MTQSTAAAALAASGSIGDVLLVFDRGASVPAGRSGIPWQQLASAGGTVLHGQPAGSGWGGFPVLHVADSAVPFWLVGDLYGAAAADRTELVGVVAAGKRPAAELNGHFLLIAHHQDAGEWHAWTSRFGTVHAYYSTGQGNAAVGTFAPAVAAVGSGRRLDWEALTAFSAFGFFPADRTHYRDVRILRPASHYVFGRDGTLLRHARYWEWRHSPDGARSYDETVAEFARLLDLALDDQTARGRIAVPISGGLDSRTTVASLTRGDAPRGSRERLWSYSYGYTQDSTETRIARRVAHARQLPFQSCEVPPYLFGALDQVMGCLEGFQDITQPRQASIASMIGEHADRVVAAHWGDVWLDDMGLAGAAAGSPTGEQVERHVLRRMSKPGQGWLLRNLCQPHLEGAEPAEVLRDYVRDGLRPLEGIADADFRVKAFKTDNWSFRWTLASLRTYQAGAFPVLPFYDTRLADFFCTVPTAMVAGRRLQIDYLRRFAPDLARVTWEARDVDLFRLDRIAPDVLVRRGLRKAWRIVRRRRPIQRNWEAQFLSAGGETALRHELLRPGLRLHSLVDPGAVAALLQSLYAKGTREDGYAVSMLLTFSTWLERYG